MFVFTGFNTMSGIQTLIFNSATNPDSGGFVPGFQGNGFIASAVIYGVFSIASWLPPSVVAWRGPRFAMFVAGLLYAQYIGQLLYPNTYMLYILGRPSSGWELRLSGRPRATSWPSAVTLRRSAETL